jgi:hypothetical protein
VNAIVDPWIAYQLNICACAVVILTSFGFAVLTELGRSSRAFSELSCRTEVMPSDMSLAMIEMGKFHGVSLDW